MEHVLTALRKRHGLTQQGLAKHLGVRRDVVAKVEAGTRRMSLDEWVVLVEALALTEPDALQLARELTASLPTRRAA